MMSIGLILEGGGTRGAYTAGVLDVLTENNIFIPVTYGISAGACNAMSYLSKQQGRNYKIFTQYASDKRYLSWGNLIRKGSIFGFDFIFGPLTNELLPFDFHEFYKTEMELRIGATDCMTGEAVFFDKSDIDSECKAVIASSSLPLVSPVVNFNGHHLLDGGLAAPIPIDCALHDGINKNIVVLTREKEYVKHGESAMVCRMMNHTYRRYPELLRTLQNRAEIYNNERAICYREQENGDAVVIEPSSPVTISRYCTKPDKMEELYQMGIKDTKAKLSEIRRFIALNS